MPRKYRPYEPDQTLLLPPSARDWLPEDHLAFFVSDAVDVIDLSAFDAQYGTEGPGNQAFDPRMMVKVMVYGYATGVFSSRKIAKKLHEDVAFRMLGNENFPSHRTIADFRKRHLSDFRGLFVQVVQMAREAGLVSLGTVAVDGSKIRANASKRKAMSYDRMKQEEKRLRQEVRDLVQKARKKDAEEDKRFGKDVRGDELPDAVATREKRLATIQAAKARLEARQMEEDEAKGREPGDHEQRPGKKGRPFKRPMGEPEPSRQDNFTDPESRIMKTSNEGYQQCYNAQTAVDADSQIIVATGFTESASDANQLKPVLDALKENLDDVPDRILADSGYASESNLQMLEGRQIDGYVALGREKGLADDATPSPSSAVGRMRRKLKGKRGRKRYRARKHIVEAPFGWIKALQGFRQFSLRGKDNCSAEWDLVCLAANLRKLSGRLEWVG